MITHNITKNISTVTTVALFEFKSQFRTTVYLLLWLFLITVIIYNLKLTSLGWGMRCIPASHPYRMLLFANILFAVFSIFFTSNTYEDISRKNENDVLFVRSFSNVSFIIGKFLGLIYLFIPAIVFMLSITLIYNGLVIHDVNVAFRYYLLYPLLITLPVLFFTLGTNMLIMFIVRIRGLYFLLLFSIYLLSFKYLLNTFHGVFDFWGFTTPMLASDFIGFGNLQSVLIHRVIYIFWGLSCLLVCAVKFTRLDQKQFSKVKVLVTALICTAAFLFFTNMHQQNYTHQDQLRSVMKALNNRLCLKPRLTIQKCDLDVTHKGREIDVRSSLHLKNTTDTVIDTCYFSLNPGLDVHSVERDGEKLNFSRELHILAVALSVEPGSSETISLHYSGGIIEEACYIDADETNLKTINRKYNLCIDKRFSFITPGYVLLTSESLWYPVSGVPFGSVFPKENHRYLVVYTLSVTSRSGLMAISQGNAEIIDDTITLFKPEYPLPQLSLVIGDYQQKSFLVDGIEYSIFVKKGHDYFSSYFKDIHDKIPELIRERKNRFEFYLGLEYPYNRFSIVEVPVQFIAYQRYWSDSPATIQPEQVFIQEKGFYNVMFDLQEDLIKAETSPKPEIKTPLIIQTYIFNSVVNPFLRPSRERKINRYLQSKSGGFLINNYILSNIYNVIPNYFDYTNNFVSDTNPFFHQSICGYLSTKQEGFGVYEQVSFPEFGSKSNYELASRVFENQNIFEACSDPKWNDIKYEALRIKNITAFKMMSTLLGNTEFDNFLLQYLTRNRYRTKKQSDYYEELNKEFKIDAEPLISDLYTEKGLPSFKITDVVCREYKGTNGKEYNYSFIVHNKESVGGIFEVRLNDADSDRSPLESGMYIKDYLIRANEAKRIGINVNYFSHVWLQTYISRNNPSSDCFHPERKEVKSKDDFFEGEKVIENYALDTEQGVIIVDNTDPGFEVYNKPQVGINLFKFHTDDEKIVPMSLNARPERWLHCTYSSMYGFPIKSIHIIKRGDGKSRARWNVDVPESGRYHVYSYRSMIFMSLYEFHYIVHHDDGIDEVVQLNKESSPWQLIGIYNFSKGKHLIELTDESDCRFVRADAIKFVKVINN